MDVGGDERPTVSLCCHSRGLSRGLARLFWADSALISQSRRDERRPVGVGSPPRPTHTHRWNVRRERSRDEQSPSQYSSGEHGTVGAYPSGHARPDSDDLWTRSSKKKVFFPPDKTLIVRFVAGFFADLNSAIWFGLNLKQQLSEEEREHKTHLAERDTFDEMLDLAPGTSARHSCSWPDSKWRPHLYRKTGHVGPLTRCVRQPAASRRGAANPDNSHISRLVGGHVLITTAERCRADFLGLYLLGGDECP